MVDRVTTSQPHDLAREFQTTCNADVKRDVTRGMKVIKILHVMQIKGRRMSQMIHFINKFICLKEKFEEI
ncbi:MAG: hypothetical protein PV344_08195 [Anaplasma sp.]|nr:hypothetical protein [Anaplasma sp.]